NQRFINNETTVMQEALQLFHEVIFQPNRDEAGFNSSVVMREKATLQSKIEAIYDDKVSFANQRLIDHMCEEEKFSTHTHGYTGRLAETDGANLPAYYDTVLSSDARDLYVSGDIDAKQMEKEVMDIFSRNTPNQSTNVEKKHPQSR